MGEVWMEKYFQFFSGFDGLRTARYSLIQIFLSARTWEVLGTNLGSQLRAVLLEAYRGVPQCLEADVRILGLL
jgi:hypothetical protein